MVIFIQQIQIIKQSYTHHRCIIFASHKTYNTHFIYISETQITSNKTGIKKHSKQATFFIWSGREDSNLRLLAPHASALPG